jgi:hypothetical protein
VTAETAECGVDPDLSEVPVMMGEATFFRYLTGTLKYPIAEARELIVAATRPGAAGSGCFEVAGKDGYAHQVTVDAPEEFRGQDQVHGQPVGGLRRPSPGGTDAVRAGTVTRAMVADFPFAVLRTLREGKPTLTWIRCGQFYARLVADGEELPGGPTLAAALCEYLGIWAQGRPQQASPGPEQAGHGDGTAGRRK